MIRVGVLLTCYNRFEKTSKAITAMVNSHSGLHKEMILDYFLVDDNSPDSTGDKIKELFPFVTVIKGTGKLFWNGGMRLAWEYAYKYDYDYYLWLNDDTEVFKNALTLILDTIKTLDPSEKENSILVGTTIDSITGIRSYGGRVKKNKLSTFPTETVTPNYKIQRIDSFNGNFVLVPRNVFKIIGNLDSKFTHAMGDTDYGLRAKRAGLAIFLLPDYIGICDNNHEIRDWINPRIKFHQRWENLNSPKGLPLNEWKYYNKRHAKILWPIYYSKVLIRVIFPFLWAK